MTWPSSHSCQSSADSEGRVLADALTSTGVPTPMTVTGATFKQIVLDVEKTVLLFVYQSWCSHCKAYSSS